MPLSRHNERPYGFSPHVIEVLKQAGWYEGRDVLGCLVLPAQYPLFQQARSILAEFGELHVGAIGPGIECATSDVVFDPATTAHLAEDIRRHRETLGIKLYPLGEVHCGHAYLIIDEQGNLYLLNHTLLPLATSFAAALEKLLLGRARAMIDFAGAVRGPIKTPHGPYWLVCKPEGAGHGLREGRALTRVCCRS